MGASAPIKLQKISTDQEIRLSLAEDSLHKRIIEVKKRKQSGCTRERYPRLTVISDDHTAAQFRTKAKRPAKNRVRTFRDWFSIGRKTEIWRVSPAFTFTVFSMESTRPC
jgi:hypothetical protein